MKRLLGGLALLLAALTLCGCTAAPPDALIRTDTERANLISASTEGLSPTRSDVRLYFRYGSTSYLAPEERQIRVNRNESLEKAVVRALIEGPQSPQTLSSLFPPGTEVLATAIQADTLFITFNDSLLGRYADEPADSSSSAWKEEGPLRRKLCLDALAATFTEAGLCRQVQVLVYRGADQSASMRLSAGFLTRSDDETLLPPQRRSEENLLTAYNTADLLLRSWMNRDWTTLYDLMAQDSSTRPDERTAADAFSAGRALTGFSLSPGTVSHDGKTAVLTAELTLLEGGMETACSGCPLTLHREADLWKMDYGHLLDWMQTED